MKLISRRPRPDRGHAEHTHSSSGPDSRALTARNLSQCSTREARALLPLETAQRYGVLPLGVFELGDQRVISIAVPTGAPPDLEQALRFAVGIAVKLLPVPAHLLSIAIADAYQGDDTRLGAEVVQLRQSEEELKPGAPELAFRPERGEAARFLASLLEYGVARGASDLHLVPRSDGTLVRLRLNGELLSSEAPVCTATTHRQIITRLKILAGLDTTTREKPLDGSFRIPRGDRHSFARLSLMPTVHGEKAVVRFLNQGELRDLNTLGLDRETLHFCEELVRHPRGAAFIAGPTGSGKTTTLYALMARLHAENLNLITIEDPVELHLEGASQTSINPELGLDYQSCLRSVLRQDPDVLLVGEIRDRESAAMALQAALTGHLLLSTVHARDAFEVVLRLHHLGIDYLSLAQAVRLIVCQQLLPKLCSRCRVIDLAASNERGFDLWQPVGCPTCDYSGFRDRCLVTEALWLDAELSRAVAHHGFNPEHFSGIVSAKNFWPLNRSLERALRAGAISLEQARALQEP